MDNLKLLQSRIDDKIDEFEGYGVKSFIYDLRENPEKLISQFGEFVRFFADCRRSLAEIMVNPQDEEAQEIYEELEDFYLNEYPEIEFYLLRIANTTKETEKLIAMRQSLQREKYAK